MYASFLQVCVHLLVVDHFAEQEDPFAGILFNGTESDVDRILHTVTKTEMAGQVDLHGTEIEQGGTEILLHPVLLFAAALYRTDQRTAVYDGNIELLHNTVGCKVTGLQGIMTSVFSYI